MLRTILGTVFLVLFGGFALAAEKEKQVTLKQLPSAVRKTVDEQAVNARIRRIIKEVEKGKTQYEVEMTVDGHSKDLIIDASGSVLEIEEETKFSSLPGPVQNEMQKRIGKGRIQKLESITRGGQLSSFEATVLIAGKKKEIKFAADGKPLNKGK